MERKQLMEKLELMKKELAKKQRRFERVKRAARVKAHVKQKIEELNQAGEGEGASAQTASAGQDRVFDNSNQHSALSVNPLEKECLASSAAIGHDSLSGKTRTVTPVELLGDSSRKAVFCKDDFPKVCFPSREETDPIVKPPVSDDHEGKQVDVIPVPGVVSGIEDSLMITPTFKSMRDTEMSNCLQSLPPTLDKYADLDSYADTFTLNLTADSSLQGKETFQDLPNDSAILARANAAVSPTTVSPTLVLNVNTQAKELNERLNTRTGKCVDRQERHNTVGSTLRQNSTPAEENHTVKPVKETTSKSVPIAGCDKDEFTLKLQDIGIAEDASSMGNQQATTSQSAESVPATDQFLDYTELDVIPFSQFELTEDFLSETTQSISNSRQSTARRKSFSALVQRKSPRLSSFDFDCSDKSAVDSALLHRRSSQQSNLFQMIRKQKKSKKALFLSSLFQYLIDEAKRDTSFVEFKLPEDIAKLVSHSTKDVEKFLDDDEPSAPTNVAHADLYPLDIQTMPETEIDPDFVSQKFCDAEFEVKCADSKRAEQHKLKDTLCVCTEPATMKVEVMESNQDKSDSKTSTQPEIEEPQHRLKDTLCLCTEPASVKVGWMEFNQNNTDSETATQPDIKEPATSEDLSQVLSSSKTNSSLCGCETESLEKAKESKTLQPTKSTRQRTPAKTEASKMSLSLKGRRSQEKSTPCETASVSSNGSRNRKSGGEYDGDTPATGLHHLLTEESNSESSVYSKESQGLSSTIPDLPPSPEMLQQAVDTDNFSSPVLFGTQPPRRGGTVIKGNLKHGDVGSGDHYSGGVTDSKWGEEGVRPVFTPSKNKCDDRHQKADRCSWIEYAGCAESGCKDAVMDTIVGMASTDGEVTVFILSVQTRALTLWTLDDQQEWSAEFHWYLPQTSKAEGACRIDTGDTHLAVLVWGEDGVSQSPFLTVFVYRWDSQHTQRFSLPLPSPVTPQRIFCLGLRSLANSVLVFGSDKAYTRGKKYTIDWHQAWVGVELDMEETSAQLVDLRPVEELPDCVVGLAADQRVLVWNHKTGGLILTLSLPDTVPALSRMFSCHSLKGYLLLHTAEAEASKNVCLVALNPSAATGRVVRTFTTHSGGHSGWNLVLVHQDVVLSVSEEGMLHVWDACSAKPLLFLDNEPGNIQTANLLRTTDSCWLLTGQRNGCLHIYSVGK